MDISFAGYVLINLGSNEVEEVRRKLSTVEEVRFVHSLIGPTDLLCYIEADGYGGFCNALDEKIRKMIEGADIQSTETLLVFARQFSGISGAEKLPAGERAWIFTNVTQNAEEIAQNLKKLPAVVAAHPVLGRYDLVVYIKGNTLFDLMKTLDDDIRNATGVSTTDTRLVLMDRMK